MSAQQLRSSLDTIFGEKDFDASVFFRVLHEKTKEIYEMTAATHSTSAPADVIFWKLMSDRIESLKTELDALVAEHNPQNE